MHIFLHEIKRGKFGVLTWSLVIALYSAVSGTYKGRCIDTGCH